MDNFFFDGGFSVLFVAVFLLLIGVVVFVIVSNFPAAHGAGARRR